MAKFWTWEFGGSGHRINDSAERFDIVMTPRAPTHTKPGAIVLLPQGLQTVWYWPERDDPLPNWEPDRSLTRHALDQGALLHDEHGDLVPGWGGPGCDRYAVDLGLLQAGVVMRIIADHDDVQDWCDGIHFEDLAYNPHSAWLRYVPNLELWRASFHRMVQAATRRIAMRTCNAFHGYYFPPTYLRAFWMQKLEGFLFKDFESEVDSRDQDYGKLLRWRHWGAACRRHPAMLEGFCQPGWNDAKRAQYLRLGSATADLFDAHWMAWAHPSMSRYKEGAVWCEFYDELIELGEPVAEREFTVIPTRLFSREHEHGRVLVNPKPEPVAWRGVTVPALDAVIVR